MEAAATAAPLELKNQHISRQLDLVPIDILDAPITVIGAGAISSWVALGLAKSGFKRIAVFDHDKVDIVNMSSQFYGIDDVNTEKVKARRAHRGDERRDHHGHP